LSWRELALVLLPLAYDLSLRIGEFYRLHNPLSGHERLGSLFLHRLNFCSVGVAIFPGDFVLRIEVFREVRIVHRFQLALALFLEEERLVRLLPDADRLVVRASDDKVALVGNGEGPHLAVVAVQALDKLELARVSRGLIEARGF
jgi:hypothetical protein